MGDDATARFNEIRDELGLEGGIYDDAQREALPVIGQWLQEGAKDPGVVVRATQTLLADGESTSPSVKNLLATFRDKLPGQWGKLAPNERRLLALQCMILANWDAEEMVSGNYRALALAASPWWTVPTPNRGLRKWIEPLLTAAGRPVQQTRVPTLPKFKPVALAKVQAATLPFIENVTLANIAGALVARAFRAQQTLAPPQQHDKFAGNLAHVRAQMQAGAMPNAYSSQMSEILTSLRSAVERLNEASSNSQNALRTFDDTFQKVFQDWVAGANGALGRCLAGAFPTEEIVWWGAARYSYRQRRPFREVPSVEERRFLAALELAERAMPWQTEPCASFLVETLVAVDVDPKETRTLGEWFEQLHLVLAEAGGVAALSEGGSALVGESAIGLPTLWLRLHRTGTFDAARVAEETQLPLDVRLKSSQWSAWLFRECLLDGLLRSPL